jgi:hypothetical protein
LSGAGGRRSTAIERGQAMEAVGGLRQWSPGEELGRAARRYGAGGVPVVPCHYPAIMLEPGRPRGFA